MLEGNKEPNDQREEDMYDIQCSLLFFFQDDDELIEISKDKGTTKNKMDNFVARGENPKQVTLNHIWKKGDRESVVMAIYRFLYANALPFNVFKIPFCFPMVEAIASFGPGLKLPNYHEVRQTILQKELQLIEKSLEQYKKEWRYCWCTLMINGWTDGKKKSKPSFLVNSPCGTVFIKSVDTSSICKNAQNMFE